MKERRNWFTERNNKRYGFERSDVLIKGEVYLRRWILYCGVFMIRLHKFFRGDDVRAPHSHPWPFWTLPLCAYNELVFDIEGHNPFGVHNQVKAWRFHFRPAIYRHIVLGRADKKQKPFYTLVFGGQYENRWGFFPSPDKFVYWKDWK